MPTLAAPPATPLFVVDDLGDATRTTGLPPGDRDALRAVAGWIETFVAQPHPDLGRAGPVCPFVSEGLRRRTLWLAPEHVTGRSLSDVAELVVGYEERFLDIRSTGADDTDYLSLVVVFTDLAADRAKDLFDGVLSRLAAPSYEDHGLVLGGFYAGNPASAIYNAGFRPFTPPVPFLLMRHAVVGDWKFFLDNDDMLGLWARRYGEAAVRALAEELRRLPWRVSRPS